MQRQWHLIDHFFPYFALKTPQEGVKNYQLHRSKLIRMAQATYISNIIKIQQF